MTTLPETNKKVKFEAINPGSVCKSIYEKQ